MRTVYMASDEKEFDTEKGCREYEDGTLPERLANIRKMVKNRKLRLDKELHRYVGYKRRLLELMKRRNPASRKNIDALRAMVNTVADAGDVYELRMRELATARKALRSLLEEAENRMRRRRKYV